MSAASQAISAVGRRLAERPDALAGLRATYRLDAGGDSWTLAIDAGTVQVRSGAPPGPDATLEASPQDWTSMLNGETDPEATFVQGRRTIRGDMDLALKLFEALS